MARHRGAGFNQCAFFSVETSRTTGCPSATGDFEMAARAKHSDLGFDVIERVSFAPLIREAPFAKVNLPKDRPCAAAPQNFH